MKVSELRSKTINELRDILYSCRKESFNIRFQLVNGQFDNISRMKILRKDIARVKTLITEKEKSEKVGIN